MRSPLPFPFKNMDISSPPSLSSALHYQKHITITTFLIQPISTHNLQRTLIWFTSLIETHTHINKHHIKKCSSLLTCLITILLSQMSMHNVHKFVTFTINLLLLAIPCSHASLQSFTVSMLYCWFVTFNFYNINQLAYLVYLPFTLHNYHYLSHDS